MGYSIEGVVGGTALLAAATRGIAEAKLVPLRQGFSMLPMTRELRDAVTDGSPGDNPLGFWSLPRGFDRTLADWSVDGPVAYVEAEFFGGAGEQRAAVWACSELILGPIGDDPDEPWPADGSPISRALYVLGVARGDHIDEFDAVGLDTHRIVDDWLD